MGTVRDLLERKGRKIWAIAPGQPVFEAIGTMAEAGIGALLVMEDERLVGIVSERDYARKVILAGKASKETPVHSIMTPNVICCSLDTSVEEAMAIMTERRVRYLPALDAQKVVGVVSIGDLVKAVIAEQKFVIEQLERYVAG
jgi:CBS domain-containing protein